MIFNSEEGIITSSEEIKFRIGMDDIMFYPVDFESNEEIKKFHLQNYCMDIFILIMKKIKYNLLYLILIMM